MARKPKYEAIEVEEGKWYALDNPETAECCDCSLVHATEFMLDGTRILWRTRIDRRQTRALRKKYGIVITRSKEQQ